MTSSPTQNESTSSQRSVAIWEWVAIGLIVALSGWRYLGLGRSIWFYSDYWGLLLNHDLSISGLIAPHAGHLAVFHVAATQLTSAIASDVAWKLLVGIRIIGWSAVVVVSWYIARRRGTAHVVALAYAASLTLFGLSAWVRGWLVGNPIAIMSILTAAFIMEHEAPVTTRRRIIVGSLGLIAVVSTGVGVVGLVALIATSLLIARARPYFVPLMIPALVYAPWYIFIRGSSNGPGIQLSAMADVPWNFAQILVDGFATFVGSSFLVGAFAVVTVISLIVWSYSKRAPSPFDLVVVLWAVGFVTLVSLTRIAAGQAQVQANRYEYVVILALLAIAVPRIPSFSKRSATAIVSIVAIAASLYLVQVNDAELRINMAFWTRWSNSSQMVVVAASDLIREGEPYIPSSPIDVRRAGMLTATGVSQLVGEAWFTLRDRSTEASLATARGDLRLLVRLSQDSASDACTSMTESESFEFDPSPFSIELDESSEVTVEYIDEYGIGTKVIRRSSTVVPLSSEVARVVVTVNSGSASTCAPAP